MKNNSFGQGLIAFFVIIGVLFIIGSIGEASEPKCIKAGCDNKQASGSSYCYLHKTYTGSGSSSHSNSSYSSKSSNGSSDRSTSSSSSSYSNKSKTTTNSSYAAVQRRAVHQRRIVMILMMTDTMIYIWMGTMTTTDMIETVIMQMAWMMQWMNLEKIGR